MIFKHQIIKNGLQSRKRKRSNYFSNRSETATASSTNNAQKHKRKQSPVSKILRGSNSQTSPTSAVDFPVDKDCEGDTCSIAEDEKEGGMQGEEGPTDHLQKTKKALDDHPPTGDKPSKEDAAKRRRIIHYPCGAHKPPHYPHQQPMLVPVMLPMHPPGYHMQYPYNQQPMLVPVMLPMLPPFQQQPGNQHKQQNNTQHQHQGGSQPKQMGGYDNNATPDQKWDEMFDCLVQFIKDTREKSTRHMTEKEHWVWDGNVPTRYKTPCGKALGRWITNQRAAKSKGSLKDDREVRLVSTGLKWNATAINSWTQMLDQLKIYVQSQTENGKQWDGNVPTNYKAGAGGEKNLGRWVNKQRSLYHAGELKTERQDDLNQIGLKWSVHQPWPEMYQSLCRYAEQQRKQSHGWDGTVRPNFKTPENPSQSLGRWVNKQLSAHANGRLRAEYVSQLESIGLNLHSQNMSDFTGA